MATLAIPSLIENDAGLLILSHLDEVVPNPALAPGLQVAIQ